MFYEPSPSDAIAHYVACGKLHLTLKKMRVKKVNIALLLL